MRLVCAWCGTAIKRPGYSQIVDPETSHGMCPVCSDALVSQERGASLQQHLDTIPIPVLLINDGNGVVTMNAKACDILGRKTGETQTQLLGKVFDVSIPVVPKDVVAPFIVQAAPFAEASR